MSIPEAWEKEAKSWARWARSSGLRGAGRINLDSFLALLPPAGRRTLDLGCGEGRLGRALLERGHRVVGVDVSPTLVELAQKHYQAVVADAAALPFPEGAFDLVAAMMSLQSVEDLPAAVCEAARVLEPGGRFCFSIVHPFRSSGKFPRRGASLVIDGSYFEPRRRRTTYGRLWRRVTFHGLHRPLDQYARALEAAGFLIEAIREPRPGSEQVRERPYLEKWARIPDALQVRALKP